MASWMVHLRIADKLMNEINNVSQVEFVIGNIAPDSGVPNEDWSVYTPSVDVSHYQMKDVEGFRNIHINEYVDQFYAVEQRKRYNEKQRSFYLGYLTHLLTDMMWSNEIVRPSKDKFKSLFDKDRAEWVKTLKKDWYDLDFLYIKKTPNFRSFLILKNSVGFKNEYVDFFSSDAFENRRKYIADFYSGDRVNVNREYTYLKEEEMDCFVDESTEKICKILKEEYL